jgi:DNA-binding transcriptional ArsR family regulator
LSKKFAQPNNCAYNCNRLVANKELTMRRDVFQAVADPTRRAILGLIALQAMTPNALAEHFDTSRQAVSKHIKILTECQLVKQQQNGREIYYHFNPQKMKEIADWLAPFQKMWEDRFSRLDQVLDNLKNKGNAN